MIDFLWISKLIEIFELKKNKMIEVKNKMLIHIFLNTLLVALQVVPQGILLGKFQGQICHCSQFLLEG